MHPFRFRSGLILAGLLAASSAAAQTAPVAEAAPEETIMREQMALPASNRGDPAVGREQYQMLCAMCHTFGQIGSSLGPDLTFVRSRFSRRDILEAILYPSKTVSDQYQMMVVEKTDGETVGGFIVSEDERQIQIRPGMVEELIAIPRSAIKTITPSEISLMPAGLLGGSTPEQITSLIGFLRTAPEEP